MPSTNATTGLARDRTACIAASCTSMYVCAKLLILGCEHTVPAGSPGPGVLGAVGHVAARVQHARLRCVLRGP